MVKKTSRRGKPTEYKDNKGKTVLDLVAVEENHRRAAKQVLALLDSEIVPLWLKEAIEDAILETVRRVLGPERQFPLISRTFSDDPKDPGKWLGVERGVEKTLALLFDLTPPGNAFTLHLSEREKLAQALSTVLHNQLTAPSLYMSVGDFVTDISTPLLDDSPEMIEKALRQGFCGWGNCPGTTDGTTCGGVASHPSDKPDRTRARRKAVLNA